VPVAEYKRLLTEAYDLDKPEAPKPELDRWMGYARAAPGPVLEVMCGSGRFLVPLAAAGIDIDGIDASADMLAACSKKCAEQKLAPGLHLQFAHELALPRRYSFETELNDWVRRFWSETELEHELQLAGFVDIAIAAVDDMLTAVAHR
jgi:SAM-dependent methyltransferase